ncbi:MAG: sulfurtransferase TusA family protein [Halanaerobium sp.]
MKEIDAKGLACPKPVVLAKKAISSNREVLVIVDNQTAASNLTKLGNKMGAVVSVVEESEDEFRVMLKKSKNSESKTEGSAAENNEGKIYLIAADTMGEGEPELGQILLKGLSQPLKSLILCLKKLFLLILGSKQLSKKISFFI